MSAHPDSAEALIRRYMAVFDTDALPAAKRALQERLAVNVGLMAENAELRGVARDRWGGFHVSQRIRAARQAAGLTSQELADRVGVTQRVLMGWERGTGRISRDAAERLAELLDVPDYLPIAGPFIAARFAFPPTEQYNPLLGRS